MTPTTSAIMPITRASVTPITSAGTESLSCGYQCLWNLGNVVFNRVSNLCHNVFNWGCDNTALNNQTRDIVTLENRCQYDQPIDIASLENRCQFPIRGLPTDVIKLIFVQCVSRGDIKGFVALGRTNIHSFITMRKLVNEAALTQLCPNLRILNAKTFTFHVDLGGVDKYKTLRSYYKLEPFVEDRAGLTIIFNHGGLTLKDMKENNCGVIVKVLWDPISKKLDNVPEEDTGPEMISNAPIIETRGKEDSEVLETRVRDEVGFDGRPTLIQYLALLIATQKELGICLYGQDPLTYGCTSTQVISDFFLSRPLAVGGSALGRLFVNDFYRGYEYYGAGGRRKL